MKKELRELLENADWVNVNSQWRTVKEKLLNERSYQKLDSFDSLKIFEDYIQYLEGKELEKDRLKKESLKKTSRQARTEFRGLLDSLYLQGKFKCYSSWEDVVILIKDEIAFRDLLTLEGYF